MNQEEIDKAKLLDRALSGISVEYLTELLGRDLAVATLTDNNTANGIIMGMHNRIFDLSLQITVLRSEITMLKSDQSTNRADNIALKQDFKDLIDFLNKPSSSYDAAAKFSTIKLRHGVV